MKRINHKSFLLVLALVFTLGCKTVRKGAFQALTKDNVYQALLAHNNDFEWWTAKADADLDSRDLSGSGDLIVRIKKDSLVWLVGKKLGIEGLRIQATPDEYAAIFRLENTYQQGSLQKLEKVTGIAIVFEDLQNIMVGNIMIPNEPEIDSFSRQGTYYCLVAAIDNMIVKYYIDGYNLELRKVAIEDLYKRQITIQYNNYKSIGDAKYAHNIDILFDNLEQKASLKLKFKDIEVNVPKNTPFSIPSHYDRVY